MRINLSNSVVRESCEKERRKSSAKKKQREREAKEPEAEKIALRLLKTEQELERLKRQGNLIGESLSKQKTLDLHRRKRRRRERSSNCCSVRDCRQHESSAN